MSRLIAVFKRYPPLILKHFPKPIEGGPNKIKGKILAKRPPSERCFELHCLRCGCQCRLSEVCLCVVNRWSGLLVTRDACGRPVSCQVELGWLPFLVRNGIFNVREARQFKNGYGTIFWEADWHSDCRLALSANS